jgi:cell wall assembly regulator SMI1
VSEQDATAAAWDRIETWLRGHAPRTLETLNGPVGEHEIREAEQVLGVRLPPGLVTSLRRHDGACGQSADEEVNPAAFCFPSEHRLLSL